MAARDRNGGGGTGRDGGELQPWRGSVVIKRSGVQAANVRINCAPVVCGRDHHNDGIRQGDHDHDSGRWHHDHDRSWWGFWHVEHPDDCCCRAGRRASGADSASGQLDKPGVHYDSEQLEHRMGIPVFPCTGGRSLISGLRNTSRLVSHRVARG